MSAESQLLIAAAEVSTGGAPPEWNNSCVTLRGDIEVNGTPLPILKVAWTADAGRSSSAEYGCPVKCGLLGDESCLQIADCTLTPGRTLTTKGDAGSPGEPSLSGTAVGASVCMTRVVDRANSLAGKLLSAIFQSIVDAGSPFCPAFAGPSLASAGATLHIENSTVIGRVWAQMIRLASNTIFWAKLGNRDPWKAPVWAAQVQTGCVRFCWLPASSIVPRQYECLPPDAASEPALLPQFITLRFGQAAYCMLSGDVPLAIWKGADNGSQMGVFQPIQETEAVTNIQIRSAEYLPANLESGVFLIPSQPYGEAEEETGYGYAYRRCRRDPCADDMPLGIGVALL